jgi:hypothetical protein
VVAVIAVKLVIAVKFVITVEFMIAVEFVIAGVLCNCSVFGVGGVSDVIGDVSAGVIMEKKGVG